MVAQSVVSGGIKYSFCPFHALVGIKVCCSLVISSGSRSSSSFRTVNEMPGAVW